MSLKGTESLAELAKLILLWNQQVKVKYLGEGVSNW